jgi:Tat protein translocase TatB subunit
MDLFGIGFGELVLILVVAIIVFGPGKLPEITRTLSRIYRNLTRTTSEFTTAIKKEIDLEEKGRDGKDGWRQKKDKSQGNAGEDDAGRPDTRSDK